MYVVEMPATGLDSRKEYVSTFGVKLAKRDIEGMGDPAATHCSTARIAS